MAESRPWIVDGGVVVGLKRHVVDARLSQRLERAALVFRKGIFWRILRETKNYKEVTVLCATLCPTCARKTSPWFRGLWDLENESTGQFS